jgi:hypothetical protein
MESEYNIKHKSSFGVILTQDEFEKARADEWHTTMVFGTDCKAPRTLDKVERHVEQSHYDYIGAPGGEEWPIPNTWMVNKIDNVDEDSNVVSDIYVRPKQVINLNKLEEEYNKQAIKEIEECYAATHKAAMNRSAMGPGLYKYLEMDLDYPTENELYTKLNIAPPTGSATIYYPKGEEPKTLKDLIDNPISLFNININKGQGDMFSYTNNSPAAGSKPSDDFKAFEKLTNKLVNKSKTYRPLPDCLSIKESSIDGLGLFAVEDIDKDVTLGVTHHYIDVGFKDELIRTPLAGFLNHSDNPNVTIEEFENGKGIGHTYKNYKLITLRPISLGEEIVVDYTKELCGLIGYDGAEFLNK